MSSAPVNSPVVKIGFIGLGTVGQGVWKHLTEDASQLERRLGCRIELARAAVRDINRKRDVDIPREKMTLDAMGVATDPELHIVCELMGGTDIAYDAVMAALRLGKRVITANKALLCAHGRELFAMARAHGGAIYFEASVGGGIPIVKSLSEGLVANRFPRIYGILNGTCNYVLTRMERERKDFPEILAEAKRLGYAEADDALDIDGWDTAHKAVVLTYIAHGVWVDLKQVSVKGIRQVTLDDIALAREIGDYRIKLLAIIERDLDHDVLSVRVQPTLLPDKLVVANVDDVFNAISVTGDVVGTTVQIGRGAGQDATASSVISDIMDAITSHFTGASVLNPAVGALAQPKLRIAGPDEIRCRYYFRLFCNDELGNLARITRVFADARVSISAVRQQPRPDSSSSLILTTESSDAASIQRVVDELGRIGVLKQPAVVIPIAEFGD